MTVDELLESLDPLPDRERLSRVAAWAPGAADRAGLLDHGDYGRRLALVAGLVTHDVPLIEAASAGPVPLLRAGLLDRRITELSSRDRRKAYRTLRRLDDPATADALIGEVRAHFGDEEAAALLPACSPGVVQELLPDLGFAVRFRALARRHPELTVARAAEWLAEARPEQRRAVWWRVGEAVLRGEPAAALDLVERYPLDDRLPGTLTDYGRLAAYAPGRVARLLLTVPAQTLPPAVLRRLTVLTDDELAPLARHLEWHAVALFEALPPARRGGLHDRIATDEMPSPALLALLPPAARTRAANLVLGLDVVRVDEAQVRHWSSYLGWAEASAALVPALRSGDAAERARGWRYLVSAALRSRDPGAVAEVITRLAGAGNEQDPVRAEALRAVSPAARLLRETVAPSLTRITTDAVEARDASTGTSAALAGLAAATLAHHVDAPALREWALFTISRVSGEAAVPLLPRFDSVLRRGQEAVVFERLRAWVAEAVERGWYGPLFALTEALGKRAWNVPGLQEMLGTVIVAPGASASVVGRAVRLWLASPRERAERVGEVLAAEPTAAVIPVVWETVCGVRTDLLDRVLVGELHGRFLEPGARWVPGTPLHVTRWLPRQRMTYVELMERVVDDPGADVWSRARALRAAARVPGAGRAMVLAHRDDAEVVIAEAALGALPWTDRPGEALSELLEYAGSDRARVALYAAGRAASHVEPSRLPALLGGVLAGPAKVTSRKEAARLLARYAPAEVMTTLLDVYRAPETHRDVRAAIVAAARQRLDVDTSWEILVAARDGSREECRAVLAASSWHVSRRHLARYARLVADACRNRDREIRREAYDALPPWLPWVDAADLVLDRFADLGEPLAAGPVSRLLPAIQRRGIGGLLRGLIERDVSGTGDAETDRPARRRVEILADGVALWSRSEPSGTDRSALITSARELAGGFMAAAEAAREPGGGSVVAAGPERAVGGGEWTATAVAMLVGLGRLGNLEEVADLCAGRPVLAVRTAERIRSQLVDQLPGGDLGPVRRLARRGDLAGGLFAVALLLDRRVRWTPERRDVLLGLRGHPEVEVREWALSIDVTRY